MSDDTSPKIKPADRARATDEHVKPLLEKAPSDLRFKTERLRQERLARIVAETAAEIKDGTKPD